jgi:NAD+ synthase (glutamine-hydrolysing)
MISADHSDNFFNLYTQGFVRVAVGVPRVTLADPLANARSTLALAHRAAAQGAIVALFPELGLSGYSNDDLFHQEALLTACLDGLALLLDASYDIHCLMAVGLPIRHSGQLLNCAVMIQQGRILGVTPKTFLPNYREFYEKRQFSTAHSVLTPTITLLNQTVVFGTNWLLEASDCPGCVMHMELCEDLWTPIPPSTYAALAGATVLLNLSASNSIIGKARYRNALCAAQSGKCLAAYLYSAAGLGESTTDLAWDGHAVVYENGVLLAEAPRFSRHEQLIYADIDVQQLIAERQRQTSFTDAIVVERERLLTMRRVSVTLRPPHGDLGLRRMIERFPFVPSDPTTRDEQCYEAYHIQVHGLAQRLEASGLQHVVIGVSGGLDSTQALLVAARTMDWLGLPRTHILAYTLPGFATSEQTRQNAHALMHALGVRVQEIDIRPSCHQMFADLQHPFADGQPVYDITFENVQAGERTSHLFRLANYHHALVLGTGDLSELALGWCTYGVGDHMSHYNVNASVPKTLIQYLIRWLIATQQFDTATHRTLQAILETEISPELIPTTGDTTQLQSTQAIIGPYALQDFTIFYITRHGFAPSKVAFLAWHAWHDRQQGHWPDTIPEAQRCDYDLATIHHWLTVFVQRFFGNTQFKRSCMPNGPKVGSGGSLSPRGDWRAPSDATATAWLHELNKHVPIA